MNSKRKKLKVVGIGSLIITCIFLFGGWILLNYKSWLAMKKIEDIDNYAQTVEQITIPESIEIIALGEATHGNKEFQELKLSVFKELVEKYGVKSFGLEADFGEGIVINEYIHGENDTAQNVVDNLSFTIYHTQQMIDLVTWMREYNDTMPDNNKVSFYGFDLQNPKSDADYIKGYFQKTKSVKDFDVENAINAFLKDDIRLSNESTQNAIKTLNDMKAELENNKEKYIKNSSQKEYDMAGHCVENILHCVELFSIDSSDYITFNNKRDELMAENVEWILEQEQKNGNNTIMIAGHNGHIAKSGGYYTSMGDNLNQKYGNHYMAIGTDYFKTVDNIADNNGRGNYSFCSADPLAAQARYMDGQMYYLDFSQLDKHTKLYSMVHSNLLMGSLGESYSVFMRFINTSHRICQKPAGLYDGMIFLYSVNPIQVIER